MNTDATANGAPFRLFITGKNNDYTQRVATESPRPTGITNDGKDIVDLTNDDTQTYHVTQQDQNLQPLEVASNPYKISIKTRVLRKIDDDEKKAKWEEMRHPKLLLLDTGNVGPYELVRCEICDPRGLIFWGLLVTWVALFIVPLILFITSNPMNPTAGNAPKVVGFAFWFAFGALVAGSLSIYCYYRKKSPDTQEMGEMKTSLKREEIYDMYCYLNNAILDDKLGLYKSGQPKVNSKINNWFESYSKKIQASNLTNEDETLFQQLFSSHKTMLSSLMANHNASWVDNEPIMAKNLKCLLCSKDENCRQLAETWVTDFVKFGRACNRSNLK